MWLQGRKHGVLMSWVIGQKMEPPWGLHTLPPRTSIVARGSSELSPSAAGWSLPLPQWEKNLCSSSYIAWEPENQVEALAEGLIVNPLQIILIDGINQWFPNISEGLIGLMTWHHAGKRISTENLKRISISKELVTLARVNVSRQLATPMASIYVTSCNCGIQFAHSELEEEVTEIP